MAPWRNLKIGVRLGLGIGTILALLLIVAGAAYFGLGEGTAGFREYRVLARRTAAAGVINGHLLVARFNVKQFLLGGTDQSQIAVSTAIDAMQAEIKDSAEEFETSPEGGKLLADIAREATAYREGFTKVVEIQKRRNGFVGQMNSLGPPIELSLTKSVLNAFNDSNIAAVYRGGDALRNLLLARLYVTKFLIENRQE